MRSSGFLWTALALVGGRLDEGPAVDPRAEGVREAPLDPAWVSEGDGAGPITLRPESFVLRTSGGPRPSFTPAAPLMGVSLSALAEPGRTLPEEAGAASQFEPPGTLASARAPC
eukprot:scaffold220000_cov24-Tisochrysis_lutea.AAC.2